MTVERVTERTLDRTPLEEEAIHAIAAGDHQYQVWNRGELQGTYLNIDKATEKAIAPWSVAEEFDAVRLRKSYGASKIEYLELRSSIDKRWMTTTTFILEVDVIMRGIPYYG